MKSPVQIDLMIVSSGKKEFGRLTVGDRAGSPYSLPICIINGINDGPILAIIAGQHGTEYTATGVALEVAKSIQPENISGAILIAPVVNLLGFEQRLRLEFPIDDRSNGKIELNSIWPGSSDGSLAHLSIHSLFNKIIRKAQYLVDLHGGDIFESMTTMSMVNLVGDPKVDQTSKLLAEVLGFDYLALLSSKSRGSSRVEAPMIGIPTVGVQIGGEGKIDQKNIKMGFEGLMRIMKYLKMIEGPVSPRTDYHVIKDFRRIMSPKGGLFIQTVPTGTMVSENDKLGEIISMDGSSVEIKSKYTGLLAETFCNPSVNSGEVLGEIAIIE